LDGRPDGRLDTIGRRRRPWRICILRCGDFVLRRRRNWCHSVKNISNFALPVITTQRVTQ
jgi:hypothetical protein